MTDGRLDAIRQRFENAIQRGSDELSAREAAEDIPYLLDLVESQAVAITRLTEQVEGFQRVLRVLANRTKAIRDAAENPPRNFNLSWQIGRLLDQLEVAAGLPSSDLEAVIDAHRAPPACAPGQGAP